MFNLGAGEIAVIMIVALLLLGPDKLPELARGIGKFVREFRRQTDDVRGMVEREFYKMDQEVFSEDAAQAKRIEPPSPAQPAIPPATGPEGGELTQPEYPSIFPPPEGVVAARPASAAPLGMEAPPETPTAPEPTATPASEATASARPERDPASHG
ncbi:MAG TPA: twin-arginine translocase TatA/TatE family subunit [Myxococcaceae bacterium]